jgi:hypothetical protein
MCLACKDGRRRNHGRRLEWCRSGRHELTPDNLFLRSDGGRTCKACKLERDRARPKQSAEWWRDWRARRPGATEKRAERERLHVERLVEHSERERLRVERLEATRQHEALLAYRTHRTASLDVAYADQDAQALERALGSPELAALIAAQHRDSQQLQVKFEPSWEEAWGAHLTSAWSRRSRQIRQEKWLLHDENAWG